MGRVEGQQIELGISRRRVSGNDLFLYHALVSQNDQTIDDLRELHPGDEATLRRYAAQTRPKFVTESWLERLNMRFSAWVMRRIHGVRDWFATQPDETSGDVPTGNSPAPNSPPSPRKRAA